MLHFILMGIIKNNIKSDIVINNINERRDLTEKKWNDIAAEMSNVVPRYFRKDLV